MYEHFTERARRVMQLANREAQRFNHEYIGTEHILLGLVEEGNGVAANVLKNLDVDPSRIRFEIEKLIQAGPAMVTMHKPPQTPRAKQVIEYSMEEAHGLRHQYVGSEHILLGLLREKECVGCVVLMNVGLTLEKVRKEVQALLGPGDKTAESPSRIQWNAWQPVVRRIAGETSLRIRNLTDSLEQLQLAKEEAVASADFNRGAQLRDQQDRLRRELQSLDLPDWVLTNLKWLSDSHPRRLPILDLLHGETGGPDPTLLALLASSPAGPATFVIPAVPRFPVSTLKAAIAVDEIGSPYYKALVPVISPESVARFEGRQKDMIRAAFRELRRFADLLCVVRPTGLSAELQSELFEGIHRTDCDFVVFEESGAANSVLEKLPAGTRLLEK